MLDRVDSDTIANNAGDGSISVEIVLAQPPLKTNGPLPDEKQRPNFKDDERPTPLTEESKPMTGTDTQTRGLHPCSENRLNIVRQRAGKIKSAPAASLSRRR
jgi:hypothetical protein